MLAALFFLAATYVPARIHAEDAGPLAADVADLVAEAEPLPFLKGTEYERRLATGRILIVWAARESGGVASALGANGLDCGVLQVQARWTPYTCDEIRASRPLGLRAGLEVMRRSILACGSVRRGLGEYAGGYCGARPELVAGRCAVAGC